MPSVSEPRVPSTPVFLRLPSRPDLTQQLRDSSVLEPSGADAPGMLGVGSTRRMGVGILICALWVRGMVGPCTTWAGFHVDLVTHHREHTCVDVVRTLLSGASSSWISGPFSVLTQSLIDTLWKALFS